MVRHGDSVSACPMGAKKTLETPARNKNADCRKTEQVEGVKPSLFPALKNRKAVKTMIIMTINRMSKDEYKNFSRMMRTNRNSFQLMVITCGPTNDVDSPLLFINCRGEGVEVFRNNAKTREYDAAKQRREDFEYWRHYSPIKCARILKKARESKAGRA